MVKNWSVEEFDGVDFNDKRLSKRLNNIFSDFVNKPLRSINDCFDSWAEIHATYNFFANEKITTTRLMKPHFEKTLARMKDYKTVLAIQDTSSLNYSGLKKTSGLGDIKDSKNIHCQGLMMHTAYAVSPEGLPLGILDQNIWAREESIFKDSTKRANTPIEDKESFKWIHGARKVNSITKDLSETNIIHVFDREGDIYEVFCEAEKLKNDFIIRSSCNRRINKKSRASMNDGELLLDALKQQRCFGTTFLEIPRKGIIHERQAEVELRALKFKITAPRNKVKTHHDVKDEIILSAIDIWEINLTGDITPIHWTLLTSIEIKSPDDILKCVAYYCHRWQIEVFHKTLKSGCRVESCRFSTAQKLILFINLMSVVAWRLHWLTWFNKLFPDLPSSLIFSKLEQQVLSLKILGKRSLQKQLTVRQAVHLLARLGGFIGRKSDGEPGTEVIWRGWTRLKESIDDFLIFSGPGKTYV